MGNAGSRRHLRGTQHATSEQSGSKFGHKPCFDHKEFKLLPLVLGHADTTEEGNKETTLAMLKLTRQMVDKLKKKANEGNEGRAYSIYETISAHIWRCVGQYYKN